MKLLKKATVILFFIAVIFGADKKVLIEVFTNSHCPLCPPAHSAIESYLQNGAHKDEVNFIFYHMPFPYSDDAINIANSSDADAINQYYGPYGSTPVGFFDGTNQTGSYSNWGAAIDQLFQQSASFSIMLTGTVDSSNVNLSAEIMQDSETGVDESQFAVKFVIVENITYAGRNGITDHMHAMRKILSPEALSISSGGSVKIDRQVTLDNNWNNNNVSFVVFVQDNATKKVYQSETIAYSSLQITDVNIPADKALKFMLSQNYPNPFNPSTIINYQIPVSSTVNLTVYNLLGQEVAVLVNGQKSAGNYDVKFDGSLLSSGIYLYKLTAGKNVITKKMLLIK